MSWLDWAVDDPAPGNCGYSALNVPCEVDPSLRRGLVVHSVEGWFTYVAPSAVMRARGNSWGVTIMRSGQVWKHRPRPTFVNWHAGGPAQNVGTDGIEMEGKDQPWTPEQRASLVRVLRETWAWFGWPAYTLAGPTDRTQEGISQALLAHGYGSLWEHNWFDYTSCPSGRDDWPWLMPQLQEQPQEEDNDMPDPIFVAPNGQKAQVGVAGKHVLGHPEHAAGLVAGGAKEVNVSQELFDVIGNVTEVARGDAKFDELKRVLARTKPLVIYDVAGVGQNVADGPYRVAVWPGWLRVLMKGPHTIVDVTTEDLERIPFRPGGGGGAVIGFSDADLQRIAAAVADEQHRRMQG